MKRLTTLLMTLMLMSAALWADETITVSANSSDISEGLDLKVVAKLFAEAKNLEEFEMMLNNPDSAFCNLDLNGDGQVDYLRVVETGEGNKRLIVLQAILAKDIYQDVASIYVEKDEKNQVSIQVIGDEYVYGTNYIIEPIYIYRPVIYDWFWGPYWVAWHSPWYWDRYPHWWYVHSCWAHDWYWHHCYAFHHHHHWCSFRPGRVYHSGYQELRNGVTRRDFASAHPERSFSQRNEGKTNAREIRNTTGVQTRESFAKGDRAFRGDRTGREMNAGSDRQGITTREATNANRTYGSRTTATTRSLSGATAQRLDRNSSISTAQRGSAITATRSDKTATAQRLDRSTATTQRSTGTVQRSTATSQRMDRSSATAQRSTATTQRSSATAQRSTATTQRSTATTQRSTATAQRSTATTQRSSSSASSSRATGSYSSSSSASRSSGGYSGSSSRSSGGFSGGSSGGSRTSSSGGSLRR